MKFEAHLVQNVDMRRINLEVLKPWLKERISDMMVDLLDLDDDIVIEFLLSQLRQRDPDPRKLQISLSGFLTQEFARIFMGELWSLLNYAQISPNGIPPELATQKQTKTKDDSIKNEAIERKDNNTTSPVVYNENEPLRIFLGNVPTDVTEEDIKTHFERFGEVTNFKRPVSKDSNEPRTFCFLTFQDRNVANEQVKQGNCSIKGHIISIKNLKNDESASSNNRYKPTTTSPHKTINFANSKKYNDNSTSYGESSTSYGDSTSGNGDSGTAHGDSGTSCGDTGTAYGDSRTKYGHSAKTYIDSRTNYGDSRTSYGDSRTTYAESRANYSDFGKNYGNSRANYGDSRANCGDSRANYGDSRANYGDSRANYGDSKNNWKMREKGWRRGGDRQSRPY